MTTPEHRHDRREHERRICAAVRAASGPSPGDDAVRRVADGAWARAGMGEPAMRSVGTRRARHPARHVARRAAVAAAALIVVGIGVVALRPTEPVFAVEGNAVKVWRGDGWQETRQVRPGATVYVAGGVDALRGLGSLAGGVIFPDPGTTLRLVPGKQGGDDLTVHILGGAAEVRGNALRLSLADVDVSRRPADSTFGVWASLPVSTAAGASPDAVRRAARTALARISMRLGSAIVRRRNTGERLDIGGDEMAALLPVERGGATIYRLARLQRFGPSLGVRIACGHPVLDVRESGGGTIAVLGGPGGVVSGITIDDADLPAALDQMRTAMLAFVTEVGVVSDDVARGAVGSVRARGGAAAIGVLVREKNASLVTRAAATGETLTEVAVTRDGVSTRIVVRGDGRVEVEHDGVLHVYASLEDARAADADAVGMLESYLDR